MVTESQSTKPQFMHSPETVVPVKCHSRYVDHIVQLLLIGSIEEQLLEF
jgi:hypothetical protein